MLTIIYLMICYVGFPISIRQERERLLERQRNKVITPKAYEALCALEKLIDFENGIFNGQTDLVPTVFYGIGFVLIVPITFPIVLLVRLGNLYKNRNIK